MLLVEHAVFFPTTCVCGEAHGRMVDTRIEKDVVGVDTYRLYLCVRCATEAGRLVDMVDTAVVEALRAELVDAQELVVRLELDVADLVPVRDAIARFGVVDADDEPVRKRRKKAA